MSKAIRVIVVNAKERSVLEKQLSLPSLEAMQEVVDGKVDLIRDLIVKGIQVDTWVNAEFLYSTEPPCFVGPFMLRGNAVISSYDPNSGDTIALDGHVTLADIQELVHFPDVH